MSRVPPSEPHNGVDKNRKLVFHCQLAHGSPMGFISNFSNVKELYQRIADCFGFMQSDILFCTLNSHKVDMEHLLGGQLGLDDFIFVHIKGQAKEIELSKSCEALGLTITDNGAGRAFIKRIKEGSLAATTKYISVGDHIECINHETCVGKRHFEVAKLLRDIPVGTNFVLRLVEPMKSGFSAIGLSSRSSNKQTASSIRTGKETLRLRATGPATVETLDDTETLAVEKINSLLESYMGISDNELAQRFYELGKTKDNPHEFIVSVSDSDLEEFGFSDDFLFDIWGSITDAKSGRLNKTKPQQQPAFSMNL